MNLGELLIKSRNIEPEKGSIIGRCVMCSLETDNGHAMKKVVSANFMGWNRLFAGGCICPWCAHLFSDQQYRKKYWEASLVEGFKTLERSCVIERLFEPPPPPFFIYVRKAMGGQRQGWLCCINKVAGSRHRFYFAHEAYDVPVWWERSTAEHYRDMVAEALDIGVSKTALVKGLSLYAWKKANEAGKMELLREINTNIGNPLWEVIVDVYPVPKPGKTDNGAPGDALQQGELVQDTLQESS